MKRKLVIAAIIIAALLAIHLVTHNLDPLGFLKQLHGM